jgi:threonine dehydrogenase-like Zn-dependent dehydrogenase
LSRHITLDSDGRLFDGYYASKRGGPPKEIPWANGAPHPMLVPWLAAATAPPDERNSALIVGSGLGDDAEAVAALGWNVTAFDVSPEAIAWTRERFPDSTVNYQTEDLFRLPGSWSGKFDLVVEVFTVQALPVTRRQATIDAICDTLAVDGELVVVALTRDINTPLRGRPWPLSASELASFGDRYLVESARDTKPAESPDQPGRVRLSLTRPQSRPSKRST